jgi:uncharacterized cupin superfamily protein
VPNLHRPDYDAEQDRAPFRWRRARLGRQAGASQLGASLFELEPGASTFPLHVHHANEEIVIVVEGRPTLRTRDGERELAPGEVIACPAGPRGAHRIDNRSAEVARVLIVSTMIGPELNEYPDTDRVWARTNAPGADPGGDDVEIAGPPADHVDPLEGET